MLKLVDMSYDMRLLKRRIYKKQIDENGLFKDYAMQPLLDEIDTIEFCQQPGKAHLLSEITGKQCKFHKLMQVPMEDFERIVKLAELSKDGDPIKITFRAGDNNRAISTRHIPDNIEGKDGS